MSTIYVFIPIMKGTEYCMHPIFTDLTTSLTFHFLEFGEDGDPQSSTRDSTSINMEGTMKPQNQSKAGGPAALGVGNDELDTDDDKAEVSWMLMKTLKTANEVPVLRPFKKYFETCSFSYFPMKGKMHHSGHLNTTKPFLMWTHRR